MKLPEMRTGLTISAIIHAALLLWGLVSFAAKPLEAKPNDALPVDIISDKQFSEITKGVKNAPKDNPLAPLAEKIGDPKPVDDSSAKVTDKKLLDAAKKDTPPPPPPPPEQQKAQAKPDKKEPPKIDPIAETLKKEEAKKKAEDTAKAKAAAQTPPKPQPSFDPNKIAALLDKREPTRQASANQQISSDPGIGKAEATGATLSRSEMDAMRDRLRQCWSPPVGALNANRLRAVLNVQFKPDGTLARPPEVVMATTSEFGPVLVESAKRALSSCQPFTMLRAEHYQLWKEMEITFDPSEMFGG